MTNDQKLDRILEILDEHGKRFDQIDARFEQIDARFEQNDSRFDKIDKRFNKIDKKLGVIDSRLDEHKRLLNALMYGQEELRASLDGFKLEVAEQFQEVKQNHEKLNDTVELMANKIWSNEKDLFRFKKIVGFE